MTMIIALRLILAALILGAGYWFWLRPLLRLRPGFKELYDQEDTFWAALSEKFAGIKQKVAGALVTISCLVVGMWDQITPMLAGVDTSQITDMVPAKWWPWITIGVVLLLNYFRRLADRRSE